MKRVSFSLSKVLVTMAAMLLVSLPAILANVSQTQMDQSLGVAKNWLALIDGGKYDDSYHAGSSEMRSKETEEHWTIILKARNEAYGKVLSRKQLSHVYKPNGNNGLNGECMVVTYETAFTHLASGTEEVQLKWEDGRWYPVGYAVGPKVDPDQTPSAPTNTTEVQTQNHVRPQPSSP